MQLNYNIIMEEYFNIPPIIISTENNYAVLSFINILEHAYIQRQGMLGIT